MMKILHIISSLEIGGAQRLLSDILPLMAKENEVTLLVNKEVDNDFATKIKSAGISIIECGCPNIHSPKNILIIAQLAKGYDVVHVHLFPTIYWAAFASLITPLNLCYTEHSTSNKRRGKWYFRPIELFVYSRYKKIISISQKTQDALTKWLKVKGKDTRFEIINNGVALATFEGLKNNRTRPSTLIMVSRFVESKDQMTVIRAMKLLPPDVHVIFVGDGDKLVSCKALADFEGVSNRVRFVGKQTNVSKWIDKADIGIQSSNWEGFGLTAVEIMAAGLPVIATEVDGLKQVVEGAGLLFKVGDEKSLAQHIHSLISDNVLYQEIATKCRKRSLEYDINKTASAYLNLYQSLTK
jgi:glycosyltransferase involved in cell wall biosynthesis